MIAFITLTNCNSINNNEFRLPIYTPADLDPNWVDPSLKNSTDPHIVNDLGGRACKVEVHNNLYKRLGAVGIEDLMKDNNPYAQYDWEKKKIYL